MKKYLISILILSSLNCWAGSTYQTYHKDMNSTTTVKDASNVYVRVCSIPVYFIQMGETLKVTSTINTTNDTGYDIGVTVEVFYCELDATSCRRTLTSYDSNQKDGGNITPAEHHKVYKPYSRMTAGYFIDNLLAAVLIRVYSTDEAIGTKLNVTGCDIDIERQL